MAETQEFDRAGADAHHKARREAEAREVVRVVKLTVSGGGPWLAIEASERDAIMETLWNDLLTHGEPGESMTIEMTEMTRAELESLPEFDGW